MGDTAITVAAPARDGTVTAIGQAMVASNTWLYFTAPKAGKFMILVENPSNAAPVFNVLAGTGLHKGLGNKQFTIAAAATAAIGPLSTSRFKSVNGTTARVNISMGVVHSGVVYALAVP